METRTTRSNIAAIIGAALSASLPAIAPEGERRFWPLPVARQRRSNVSYPLPFAWTPTPLDARLARRRRRNKLARISRRKNRRR